jgi:hypothetical protein
MTLDDDIPLHIGTFEHEGRTYNVSCRVSFDGIEHVGRLWFQDDEWDDDAGLTDRGCLSGRTPEDVIAAAKVLTPQELALRFRRAQAEKRRYIGLRRLTDEILNKIRYLNQVAISMRAGLLDIEGAAQEIDLTERQLHECIDKLREFAGVESQS